MHQFQPAGFIALSGYRKNLLWEATLTHMFFHPWLDACGKHKWRKGWGYGAAAPPDLRMLHRILIFAP